MRNATTVLLSIQKLEMPRSICMSAYKSLMKPVVRAHIDKEMTTKKQPTISSRNNSTCGNDNGTRNGYSLSVSDPVPPPLYLYISQFIYILLNIYLSTLSYRTISFIWNGRMFSDTLCAICACGSDTIGRLPCGGSSLKEGSDGRLWVIDAVLHSVSNVCS